MDLQKHNEYFLFRKKKFSIAKKRLQIQFMFVFLFLVVVFVVVVYCLFTGWFIRNHSEKNLFFHFDGTEKNSWFMGSPDSIWWPIVFVAVVVVWDVLSVFCWILSIIVVVFRYRSIIGRPNIYTINFHFSSHLTITELFILICIFFVFKTRDRWGFQTKKKFSNHLSHVCMYWTFAYLKFNEKKQGYLLLKFMQFFCPFLFEQISFIHWFRIVQFLWSKMSTSNK